MTRRRIFVRSVTGYLWYTFVIIVIALAVTMTAARLLLPEAKGYRERVEHWASGLLGQPVRIAALDATLEGFTPTITFKDVRLLDKHGKRTIIRFREARVGIGLLASLQQWRLVPKELTVVGAKLRVTRYRDGRFAVRGMQVAALSPPGTGSGNGSGGIDEAASQLTAWLFQRDVLAIKDSEVHWQDFKRGHGALDFSNVNIHLRNAGDRHQLDFDVTLPARIGQSLSIAVDATGNVSDPASLQGEFYARAIGLHVSRLGMTPSLGGIGVRSGDVDMTLWGGWRNGILHSLEGSANASGLVLEALGHKDPLKLSQLGGNFDWRRSLQGWTLDLARLHLSRGNSVWPETQIRVVRTGEAPGQVPALDVKASFLRLDDLASVLLKSHKLDKSIQTWLQRLQPSGDIDGLHVHVDTPAGRAPSYRAQARFTGLGLKAYGHIPGFEHLSGGVWLDEHHGGVQLDGHAVALSFPRLFRHDLKIDHLLAHVNWRHAGGEWNISAPRIVADNVDARTASALLLEIPDDGGSPYIDLQSAFTMADVARVPHYLPARVMGSHTVAWLDHAFRSGRVSDGGLVLTGRLADFPFADHRGQFQVKFHAHDMTLAYQRGWPVFQHGEADATFTGLGMAIRVPSGKVFNSDLRDVRADIARFKAPVLVTSGRIEGSTADAVRFLAESPLGASAAATLKALQVGGKSTTRLTLHLPLSKRMKAEHPLHVDGQVTLHDSSLALLGGKLDIDAINGTVHFTNKGQSASGIQARVMGGPAEFDVYTPVALDNHQTFITGRGRLDTKTINKRHGEFPLWKYVRGQADWQAQLTLSHGKEAQAAPVILRVTSDLDKAAIDLPAPMHKPSGEHCLTVFDAKFLPRDRADLHLDLGHLASIAAELGRRNGQPDLLKGEVRFGGRPAVLPTDKSLRIAGSIEGLSLANWRDTLAPWFDSGRSSRPFTLRLPVIFDMDRLYVLKGGGGVGKAHLDPRRFPIMRGEIRELRYDKLDLGTLSFDTARDRRGLALRSMRLARPKTTLIGHGWWHIGQGVQTTSVDAELKSEDFGGFLRDMGLAAVISGGQTDSKVNLSWPGSPFGFSFAHLAGGLNVSVKDGTMEDINPGAGRIFGLLSLQALPRRLILDFGDVFKKGFAFDSITGTFAIKAGNAQTNNLIVKSPSARILMQGRTGLAARDYDQLVTVVPEVGSSLPVAGGLAWGAQAGAIILLIERLFKSEIDKAAQYQYKITGTWDHPIIKRLAQPAKTHKPVSEPTHPAPKASSAKDFGGKGNAKGEGAQD